MLYPLSYWGMEKGRRFAASILQGKGIAVKDSKRVAAVQAAPAVQTGGGG